MRRILSLFLFGSLLASAQSALDLTPELGERVLEGVKFRELIFRDGDRKVTYEPPTGWTCSGASTRLRLLPPNTDRALAEVIRIPLPAPMKFTEETLPTLQAQALASVPANASKVTVISAEQTAFTIGAHETFEVLLSYEVAGATWMMSTVFANSAPDFQLCFRVTAQKNDFEEVHKAFRGSLFSWQEF